MAQTPSINDRQWNLIWKVAVNLYDAAVAGGISGLNPPSINDTEDILWKKSVYYTARLA